jgi:Uma2 family endonuclease
VTPERITLDEFAARHAGDYVELIDGVVVPLIRAGTLCGFTGGNVVGIIGKFVDEHGLRTACCNDTFVLIRMNPPRVRGADFCFWRPEAIPDGDQLVVIESPPELCVEMRSPTYDWPAIFEKVADYLSAGVKVVLVLDPYTKTASVYRPDAPPQALTADDTLTIPDVLPGFSTVVRDFFE